jgi:general secretion pathway protein G
MKKNQKGFTLIELLVVIAIIGLLSTLSVVALNSARAKSRDARRISDIQQIQSALEMYFNDANAYPATLGTSIIGSSTYLAIVPTAPTPFDNNTGSACNASTNLYSYTVEPVNGVASGSYTLTYCLGSNTGSVKAGLNTATPAGISIQ